ncbi:M28 family metallopeptidase [Sphingomonas sp. ID0503]|uniref:M28 family metallopeptidase n=1 Tax=Sphingomonas sp. ID0503 TaxID=3399691 RepID=UPI003AFA7B4A
MRLLTLLALTTALAAPLAAETPVFSADAFRSHVAFLSDDLLEGRDTGSKGYDIAARYVATQFEGLGLKPGGENGGWYQQVTFRKAVVAEGSTPKVTITGPAGEKSWDSGTEVVVSSSLKEEAQDVSAPVVFVGYGIVAPRFGIDDYKGLDVKGKIVAYLSGEPRDLPSEIAAHYGDEKAATASAHGAIGTISLPTEESAKTFPWKTQLRYAKSPKFMWLDKAGKVHDEAPNVRVGTTLNETSAAVLFADAPKTYAAIRKAASAKGAKPKGFPLKTSIRIERRSSFSQLTSPEVIGILPGTDPTLKAEYVVLMGHLDHLGLKADAKAGEDKVYNGALDNAAGVATMLEAAKAFVASGKPPRRSVMFIANTAEERGLLGAQYFANNPTVPIGQIVGLVDLDMPLILYPFTDVVAFGADHSTVARAVQQAGAEMGVKVSPDFMPEEGIFTRSDHYEFVKQGVPAILLATGPANGGDKVWPGFLGGNYHGLKDDMSQPILWDQGACYAKLNYLISRDLADAEERPLWYQGDFFGDLYAPGKPRAAAGKQ